MAAPKPETLEFADHAVAAEVARWLGHLGAERRMSDKTLQAYRRDVRQFLGFLAGHFGSRVTLKRLSGLAPADVRAFMASRRAAGIGGRSLMRGLAGARSFARFLERDGNGKVAALAAVRAPKIERTLPKPLSVAAAKRVPDADVRAGEEREPWVLARDAAVLALLYGCGLRISEALGLKPKEFAGGRDALTVTGKGNKTRMVPLLPQVAKLVADYVALCPYDLPPDGPRSSAPKEARSRRASSSSPWRGCAAHSDCRKARPRMRCGIPSPPISWRAAATCAPSRSCSATPRCRRRRSTPRSTASGCSRSTAAPIRAHDGTMTSATPKS